MIQSLGTTINPIFSIPPGNPPDMTALRSTWKSLQAEEASTPRGQRLGIARRRMELLSAFPSWRIPEVIDALNAPEKELCHA